MLSGHGILSGFTMVTPQFIIRAIEQRLVTLYARLSLQTCEGKLPIIAGFGREAIYAKGSWAM